MKKNWLQKLILPAEVIFAGIFIVALILGWYTVWNLAFLAGILLSILDNDMRQIRWAYILFGLLSLTAYVFELSRFLDLTLGIGMIALLVPMVRFSIKKSKKHI